MGSAVVTDFWHFAPSALYPHFQRYQSGTTELGEWPCPSEPYEENAKGKTVPHCWVEPLF